MDLRIYLDILKRRALAIVIVAATALAVVTIVGLVRQPVYTSSTTVRVLLDVGIVDFKIWGDQAQRLLNTYGHVLTSGPTLGEAIDRLSPRASSLTVAELRDSVEIEIIPTTELISISVTNGDPALARDLASTLATLLIEYAQDLYVGSSKSSLQIMQEQLISLENDIASDRQQLETLLNEGTLGSEVEALRNQIEFQEDAYDRLSERYEMARLNDSLRANSVTVVAPATLPRKPSNVLGLTEIGIALIVGVFSGVALALVLENVDTHIYSPEQLERLTDLPVLGTVPIGLASPDSFGGAVSANGNQSIEEAYRLLGMTLQMLKGRESLQTVLITSASPKEGKSIVSANLARALAERGQTVFLVESDLRRPTLTKMLDIADGNGGLSDLLTKPSALGHESLGKVMHPAKQTALFVIGGGPKVANPTSALASPAMTNLLDYLRSQSQMTLLDAPPVLGLADISVLVPRVDGVVLVVRQAYSKRERLLAAIKQLETSRAPVKGFIFLQKDDKEWIYE